MAIENINVGALPNDGSGDAVRVAFGKVNNNFTEVGTLIDAAEAAAIPATEKGAASGVATLNAGRTLTAAQRPSAGLYLPGTAGNYARTPDAAALDITGDIDLRALVAAADWTSGATQQLMAKSGAAAGNRSWQFQVSATGIPQLAVLADGSTYVSFTGATAPITDRAADGEAIWVRATLDVDNGAAGRTYRFYTSEDGVTGTQLGADVVVAGTTSIFAGTDALEVGSRAGGASDRLTGTIYRAQVYSGIGGTLVADFDASSPPSRHGIHPSRFTDSVGNAWTINGSAWEYRDDLGRTLATAAEAKASTPKPVGWKAGYHMTPAMNVAGARSMSASIIFCSPWLLPYDLPISGIAVEVATAAASSSVRLGAYKVDDLGRAELLFDAGLVDTSTTGVKTIAVTQTLPRGVVYLVAVSQTAAGGQPQLRAHSSVLLPYAARDGFPSSPNTQALGSTAGVLPALITNPGLDGSGVTNSPVITVVIA